MEGLFNLPPNWKKHWRGMPEFSQQDLEPYQTINVHFRCPQDREDFARLVGRKLHAPGRQDKSIWWPRETIDRYADKRFKTETPTNPQYPVYIISKGRWESRLTSKSLEQMNVPYRIVVEPQERKKYARVIDPKKILVLPFSNLGKGSIPARNWVWEHALAAGAERHWILDDNIGRNAQRGEGFYRLYRNIKTPVHTGATFAAAEHFVNRFENVGLAGFNYFMFASRKSVVAPYKLNTRIYSCILIRNDLPFRWRGRYNEDTDLSLRVLKAGWCTVLFNAFLCYKQTTMKMKGGNTDELYQGDGRREMAESLQRQHPDVTTVTRKWGRWQHHVDYSPFARNKLKPKYATDALPDVNNFGMYLEQDEPNEDQEA